jgi:hypothetical protein
MREEVESYPDDTKVNWSDMAQRYSIRNTKGEIAKNGGQVAQEWLNQLASMYRDLKGHVSRLVRE